MVPGLCLVQPESQGNSIAETQGDPNTIDTVRTCPSCREELDAKLRASVDIALKAIRLLALQGAIPEMVFVRDPSLIQRSEAPATEAL